MGQKRFNAEQIIRMLREAEVELFKGQTVVLTFPPKSDTVVELGIRQ